MRSAGMSQRAASRSNSAHRAPISSVVRTKVMAISATAIQAGMGGRADQHRGVQRRWRRGDGAVSPATGMGAHGRGSGGIGRPDLWMWPARLGHRALGL